jgi:hypothetical protein
MDDKSKAALIESVRRETKSTKDLEQPKAPPKASFRDFAFQGRMSHFDDEVSRYLADIVPDEKASPLEWWRNREGHYTKLSRLAQQYLAIPASNAPSERAFSAAKRLFDGDRNRLSASLAETLIMLHHNLDAATSLTGMHYFLS